MKTIVHVSPVELDPRSGMGRVACHWVEAIRRRGYQCEHFGPGRVGRAIHPALWHRAAVQAVVRSGLQPEWVFVHEPAAYAFHQHGFRTAVFSHGLERRGARVLDPITPQPATILGRLRRGIGSRMLWVWRRRQCDQGMRHCARTFLCNKGDASFVRTFYGRAEADIRLYRNGADPLTLPASPPGADRTILFYGSWILRKGNETFVEALSQLRARGVDFTVLIACGQTISSAEMASWPDAVRSCVKQLPRIESGGEAALYAQALINVLPSWYEGQPLTLLQALACGRCCVASAIDGHVDLIDNGKTGLLFPPGDGAALADRLQECLSDPHRSREMGLAAARSMAGRTWPAVADEVIDWLVS